MVCYSPSTDVTNQSQKTFPLSISRLKILSSALHAATTNDLELASICIPDIIHQTVCMIHSPETSGICNRHLFSTYYISGQRVIEISKL